LFITSAVHGAAILNKGHRTVAAFLNHGTYTYLKYSYQPFFMGGKKAGRSHFFERNASNFCRNTRTAHCTVRDEDCLFSQLTKWRHRRTFLLLFSLLFRPPKQLTHIMKKLPWNLLSIIILCNTYFHLSSARRTSPWGCLVRFHFHFHIASARGMRPGQRLEIERRDTLAAFGCAGLNWTESGSGSGAGHWDWGRTNGCQRTSGGDGCGAFYCSKSSQKTQSMTK